MPLVTLWTGREVKALRAATRYTLEAFAARLGVTERMVSKWESGGAAIQPRMSNQAALDHILAQSDADAHGRFIGLLETESGGKTPAQITEPQVAPILATEPVRHPADGKAMAAVPEGIFLGGSADEPIWVDAFLIDVCPVTNADFARFCAATGHTPPRHWEGKRCPRSLYDHPVVWVTWDDASAYAAWAGKRLPSAEEWEKAARGTAGDIYPWGRQQTAAKCNVRESRIGTTTPVSRYHSGASPYGVYDMCGNVWEWSSTATISGRYELKGSAFTSPFFRCTPSAYNDADKDMADDDTGFRCAAAPADMPAQ
ncbi:SUMF1/EgtB/PvdO family nonheme iron enzyme [Streptomyces sp. NPDC017940]|uniref:SUMF1/EgtB/PvdO family nonheme iron enzyme n=1 Tax=Streptomyces sp. NPDC017940 TaxID=3365017 RepID=UPI0037A4DC82